MNFDYNLQKVSINPFPASTLHHEEIDLLLSVANRFVERYPVCARPALRGSFCLIGQKGSDFPDEIIAFDFPGGSYVTGMDINSRELVNAGIEHALRDDSSIVYVPHEKLAANTLTLNTKYGRFIMSVFLSPRNMMRQFLLEMACAIKEIGYSNPGDKTLNFSYEGINVSKEEALELSRLESAIWGDSFSAPEMITWHIWHHSHERKKGGFGLFFEDSKEPVTATTTTTESALLWA